MRVIQKIFLYFLVVSKILKESFLVNLNFLSFGLVFSLSIFTFVVFSLGVVSYSEEFIISLNLLIFILFFYRIINVALNFYFESHLKKIHNKFVELLAYNLSKLLSLRKYYESNFLSWQLIIKLLHKIIHKRIKDTGEINSILYAYINKPYYFFITKLLDKYLKLYFFSFIKMLKQIKVLFFSNNLMYLPYKTGFVKIHSDLKTIDIMLKDFFLNGRSY